MEYFPLILVGRLLILVGGFLDVTDNQSSRSGAHRFLHSWGGGDPTILYNITGYGLNGLFF